MPRRSGPAEVTIAGAAWALLAGACRGVSRRDVASRLRAALRPGGGSVAAFDGTPCSRLRSERGPADAAPDRQDPTPTRCSPAPGADQPDQT